MKEFFITFIMVLIFIVIFFLFGGFMLLDFKKNFWLAVLFLAIIISVIIYFFVKLSIRVEELENKVSELDGNKKDA